MFSLPRWFKFGRKEPKPKVEVSIEVVMAGLVRFHNPRLSLDIPRTAKVEYADIEEQVRSLSTYHSKVYAYLMCSLVVGVQCEDMGGVYYVYDRHFNPTLPGVLAKPNRGEWVDGTKLTDWTPDEQTSIKTVCQYLGVDLDI